MYYSCKFLEITTMHTIYDNWSNQDNFLLFLNSTETVLIQTENTITIKEWCYAVRGHFMIFIKFSLYTHWYFVLSSSKFWNSPCAMKSLMAA